MNYLDMLDNDLCLAINEGSPLTYLSNFLIDNPKVLEACSGCPIYERDHIQTYIYDLWCMLDNEKKTEVYEWLLYSIQSSIY